MYISVRTHTILYLRRQYISQVLDLYYGEPQFRTTSYRDQCSSRFPYGLRKTPMLSLRCLWSSYLMRCFIIGCSNSVVHYPTNSTLKQAETLSILSHKPRISCFCDNLVESRWNVMAHGDARERKWRGNWRMECVASTLHTTLEHGVSSITTADAHKSAAK